VPPGDRVFLGSLQFLVLATAQAGPAAVTPVEHIGSTSGGPDLSVWVDGVLVSAKPNSFVSGSVDVLPPEGPRPVADFVCEQFLDRIRLSFKSTETYDLIEIDRDGTRIATLPGDASQHTDALPSVGQHRYTVTAVLRGQKSVPASCEVRADPPSAPPVRELTCGDTGLTWQNPTPFDLITVFRNGEEIAQLPGIASSYVDRDRPEAMTLYSVVSELEGFRSPQSNCLDHSVWIMEVGDVRVPIGATRVLIPIYGTTALRLENWDCHLQIPQDRLKYIRDRALALQGTALDPELELFATGIGWLLRAAVEDPGAEAARGEGGGCGADAASGSNVVLSWRNAAGYKKIRVERNGVVVAEIDGQATGFRDAGVPASVYTYKVVGEERGATSFPAHTFLSTVAPRDAFIRGDANRDGKVSITDPLVTLAYLFRAGGVPRCEDGADADDDGRITITDAITILQYLFLGGAILPAPGTAYPWYDPTPDSLTCTG